MKELTDLLTTKKVKKLVILVLFNIYSELYLSNLLYARPIKTITVCSLYNLLFVGGIAVTLLLVITVKLLEYFLVI